MQTQLITTLMLATALFTGAVRAQGGSPAHEAKEAQILEFRRSGDGMDVVVAGPPGQLYGLMASSDGVNWEFVGIVTELEEGIYLAFDDRAAGQKRRFLAIVSRDDQYRQFGQQSVQNIVEGTPGVGDLKPHQRGPLVTAAQNLINATNHVNACRNQLIGLERNVADCLKLVAAAKLAMEQAQAEAAAAAKAAQDAVSALSGINSYLQVARGDLATAQSRTDQWEHEMNVLLDWVTNAEAAGNSFHAGQYRANAANAQANYEEWSVEKDRIAESIAAEEVKVEAAENAVTTTAAASVAAASAAAAAEAAFEKAKKDCDPTKTKAQQKRDEIKDVEADQKAASQALRNAQNQARRDAAKNRADEAAAEEVVGTSTPPPAPEKEVNPDALRRMREIAKFLEFLKAQGADAAYESAISTIFGSLLDAGTTTLDAIGSMMSQLAQGGSGVGGAALTGVASGLVQAGYGVIVTWVQNAAEGAAKAFGTRTIAVLAILEVPKAGDVKCVNVDSDTAYLFIRNADGTVTTFVYSRGSKLTSGRYKLP